MGKMQGMIHPEAKLLSSCEPVKPEKLCTSKYSHGTGISKHCHSKREKLEERGDGAKPVQSLARQISLDLKAGE